MVHFKVIKGSHIVLTLAILVLICTVGAMILTSVQPDSTPRSTASLVSRIPVSGQSAAAVPAVSVQSDAPLEFDAGTEDIEIIPEKVPAFPASPRVLIYHTHTHEAYEQVADDRYVALEAWRTTDQSHSVVRVGQELKELLEARGFTVVHDTTDHEQNELGTAYTRSLRTLETYREPFDLYIDLHRDAYIEGVKSDWTEPMAQMMLLIGNGEGFKVKPHYPENLAFAQDLTKRINRMKPGLCKEVLVKDGRYNQNIGVFSVLLEVGHNRNTLPEALACLPYFADAVQSVMMDSPDPGLLNMYYKYHSENYQ